MTPQEVAQFVLDRDADGNLEMGSWGHIDPDEPLNGRACIAGWAAFAVRQDNDEFSRRLRDGGDVLFAVAASGSHIGDVALVALGLPYSAKLSSAFFTPGIDPYDEEFDAYMTVLKDVLHAIANCKPGQEVNVALDVLSNALNTRPIGDVLSIERAVDALRIHFEMNA